MRWGMPGALSQDPYAQGKGTSGSRRHWYFFPQPGNPCSSIYYNVPGTTVGTSENSGEGNDGQNRRLLETGS